MCAGKSWSAFISEYAESQNHQALPDLQVQPSTVMFSTSHVPRCHIHTYILTLSGVVTPPLPRSVPGHPFHEEIFPKSNLNHPWHNLRPFPFILLYIPGRGLLEKNQAPEEHSSSKGDKPTSLVLQVSLIPVQHGHCWRTKDGVLGDSHSVDIRVSIFLCCAS